MLPVMKRLALLLLFPASVVGAQAVAPEELERRDQEARTLFDSGEAAYQEGRFESALQFFEASYALSHRVELLFNIGSSADRLRRDERAISAFHAYLDEAPDADNRATVERRLAILEGQGGEDEDDAGESNVLPWALVGAGGAVAVSGAVVLGIALSRRSAVEGATEGRWADYESRADSVGPLSTGGIIALSAGGVLAIVGLTLALTRDGSDDAQVSLDVGLGSLGLRGAF